MARESVYKGVERQGRASPPVDTSAKWTPGHTYYLSFTRVSFTVGVRLVGKQEFLHTL